jgi:hypothetical protein
MMKVSIKPNKLGDTRTATKVPTFAEFIESNRLHRKDVRSMMDGIAFSIQDRGKQHDITKVEEPHESLFYRELCEKIEGKIDDFTNGAWYPMHCKTERHHLLEYCPEDVNLIDVIEMICDCVCAGMARSGNVYPVEIPPEILQQAVRNTVQMCIDSVVIEKEDE